MLGQSSGWEQIAPATSCVLVSQVGGSWEAEAQGTRPFLHRLGHLGDFHFHSCRRERQRQEETERQTHRDGRTDKWRDGEYTQSGRREGAPEQVTAVN